MSTPANAPYKLVQRAAEERLAQIRYAYRNTDGRPAQRYTNAQGQRAYRPWPLNQPMVRP